MLGTYGVNRSFLECDTSSVFPREIVEEVKLTLTAYYDGSATDFDLTVRECDWTPILAANREANYDAALAAALDAVWRGTAGIVSDTNYTGPTLDVSRVGKGAGGKWQAALVSQRDVDGTAPGGDEYVSLYTNDEVTQSY